MIYIIDDENTINSDWLALAKTLSEIDLKAHPDTDKLFELFSEDAIFIENGKQVGRTTAYYLFKMFCNGGVLQISEEPTISIKQDNDHIIWSFTSKQMRKRYKIMPTSLFNPVLYKIDYTAHLYFSTNDASPKINKFDVISNIWTPI